MTGKGFAGSTPAPRLMTRQQLIAAMRTQEDAEVYVIVGGDAVPVTWASVDDPGMDWTDAEGKALPAGSVVLTVD